jgi:alkylation response protein AidB-like acyl-CoA dehydrogenase
MMRAMPDTPTRLFGDHALASLDGAERAMLERVRGLARDVFGPRAAEVAREDVFAWEHFRLLAAEGVIGTAFPRRFGGSDARQVLRIRIVEELGRVCSASASLVTGTDLSSRAIVAGASEAMQQALLPGLCDGTLQAAFALTEPGAGSDVRGLATTFRRTEEGYALDGRKKFITRAGVADWFVVVGRDAEAADRFVAALVPRGAAGVTVPPDDAKLGWFGVPIASPAFRGVAVPREHRLGAEGDGFALAQDALLRARIGHAAMAIGRAMGAAEIAAAWAAERRTFGRALGAHQGVQWILADAVVEIEAARALLAIAAEKYDRGDADVAVWASMAKLRCTDLGMRVASDALQLAGGRGYLREWPLERFFRDAKLNQIGEGASEVHRTVIGRDVVRRAGTAERHPCLPAGPLDAD